MRRVIAVLSLSTMLLFGCVCAAWADADEAEPAGLSLDEAIERALQHSTIIKQAELDVDRAREVADAAWDLHGYSLLASWTGTGDLYTSREGVDENSWFRALSADRQWHIQKAGLGMRIDAVLLQVQQSYYNVIKQATALERAKAAAEKAERDYRTTQVMANIGMGTSVQVDGARAALEGARSELEQAQGDYEGAYRELNKLIGFRLDERPLLSTPLEFEVLEVPSVDAAVSRALSVEQNPYLWSLKEGHELSRYVWTFTQPQEAGKIDIDKAKLGYEDARENTRNLMYALYDRLKTLEAAHESATAGVAAAEEALRIAELKYQLGMITRTDVLDAQAKLAQVQEGLYEIRILYALTKEQFLKPWLASAGAAAGGQGAGQGSKD